MGNLCGNCIWDLGDVGQAGVGERGRCRTGLGWALATCAVSGILSWVSNASIIRLMLCCTLHMGDGLYEANVLDWGGWIFCQDGAICLLLF